MSKMHIACSVLYGHFVLVCILSQVSKNNDKKTDDTFATVCSSKCVIVFLKQTLRPRLAGLTWHGTPAKYNIDTKQSVFALVYDGW